MEAISTHEGGLRFGEVGDNGTSFGPFMLHIGGAMPAQYSVNARAASAFANSPAGVDYAMRQMAQSGASGLTGQAAVSSIARNFERPANPAAEIADAMSQYGKLGGGAGTPSGAGMPSTPVLGSPSSPDVFKQMLAGWLLSSAQGGNSSGPDFGSLLQLAQMRQALGAAQQAYGPTPQPGLPLTMPQGHLPSEHGYVLPVQGKVMRLDQGVDIQGTPGAAVRSLGSARVDAVKADPGGFGQAVYYTVLNGPLKGRQVYVGHAAPSVRAGQVLRPGSPVATLLQNPLGNATQPGWTEIGFAQGGVPQPGTASQFHSVLSSLGL